MTGLQVIQEVMGYTPEQVSSLVRRAKTGYAPAISSFVAYSLVSSLKKRGLSVEDIQKHLSPVLDQTRVKVEVVSGRRPNS